MTRKNTNTEKMTQSQAKTQKEKEFKALVTKCTKAFKQEKGFSISAQPNKNRVIVKQGKQRFITIYLNKKFYIVLSFLQEELAKEWASALDKTQDKNATQNEYVGELNDLSQSTLDNIYKYRMYDIETSNA